MEHQIDTRLERGLRALAAQGMKAEDMRKMDFTRLRAGQKDSAKKEVQVALLLEKIADKENIEVTDEDVEKEIQIMAAQAQQPADTVRARLTQDGSLDRIRHRIRNDKTLELSISAGPLRSIRLITLPRRLANDGPLPSCRRCSGAAV